MGLMALPMFLDERIHLRWAYWIEQGRRLRVPLLAGRGLSVYLLAGVAPHAGDPLRAGRLLTVAIGLVTLVAGWQLALRLTGDRRVADVTALFSIACPFTLLYDRMVLTDAFLAAFAALTLLLSIALAEQPRPRTGAVLGLALALGVLSKTSGLVLFAMPAAAWALLGRDRKRGLVPLATAYLLAAALVAYPLWLFLRKTDELAGALGLRDGEAAFRGNAGVNLGLAASWLWAYWTPPLIVLALIGLAPPSLGARTRGRAAPGPLRHGTGGAVRGRLRDLVPALSALRDSVSPAAFGLGFRRGRGLRGQVLPGRLRPADDGSGRGARPRPSSRASLRSRPLD
jgi:4-amino-4-deoxy-L-arabinose transferase-like glycosyltransferase